jgi:hypothetical protein
MSSDYTLTARLPITNGAVTCLNDGETYTVADIFDDDDTKFEFIGSLGGPDLDNGAWPAESARFDVDLEETDTHLVVTLNFWVLR